LTPNQSAPVQVTPANRSAFQQAAGAVGNQGGGQSGGGSSGGGGQQPQPKQQPQQQQQPQRITVQNIIPSQAIRAGVQSSVLPGIVKASNNSTTLRPAVNAAGQPVTTTSGMQYSMTPAGALVTPTTAGSIIPGVTNSTLLIAGAGILAALMLGGKHKGT
jgi:hypothetical protein